MKGKNLTTCKNNRTEKWKKLNAKGKKDGKVLSLLLLTITMEPVFQERLESLFPNPGRS